MSSTDAPALTPVELAALERELTRQELWTSPASFASAITRHDVEPWIPYAHLLYVNAHILNLVDPDHPLDRLLVTLPFRHGKSLFCSTHTPAWYLNRWPQKRVILASYADEFAERWGRDVRQLIEQNPGLLNVQVSKASAAANRWDLEGHRGGMKTAGVGGQLTGWGAHLFIVDDPVKDDIEAQSLLQRDTKWRWWNTVAQSRLEPGASVLVIGTRYHEDDFIGRLLLQKDAEGKPRWLHINLPALAEEDDLMGRKPGEALCPERYNENALATIRQDITPSAWLSGYQQRPTPEGGGRFKRESFRYWTDEAHPDMVPCYTLLPSKDDPDQERLMVPKADVGRFITIDTALSLKTAADWTVAAVWDIAGWTSPSRLILHDLVRERMEGDSHLGFVRNLYEKYKPTWIGIEDTAISMTLISQCLRVGLPVRRLKPERDKYGRSESAVILLQQGRVYFPAHLPWYGDFEHELLSFPASTHDDQVDVFSYAAREFARGYGVKRHPRPEDPVTIEDRARADIHRRRRRDRVHPVLGRWPGG